MNVGSEQLASANPAMTMTPAAVSSFSIWVGKRADKQAMTPPAIALSKPANPSIGGLPRAPYLPERALLLAVERLPAA